MKQQRVVECQHPYKTPCETVHEVVIEGARSMEVFIDPRSGTKSADHFLKIVSGVGASQVTVARFCGPGPWVKPDNPVIVEGANVTLEFCAGERNNEDKVANETMSENKDGFGYKCTVKADVAVRPLSWVHSLARTSAWLCGQLAAAMLNGTDEEDTERCLKNFLSMTRLSRVNNLRNLIPKYA